jgi:hypothetical protein
MPHLIANKFRTPNGTILQSLYRNDYVTVTEGGIEYSVDGGTDYLRHSLGMENLCVYSDAPFEVVRANLRWGTYGSHGNLPLRYVVLKDMEDEHIRAVLRFSVAPWRAELMQRELDYRVVE